GSRSEIAGDLSLGASDNLCNYLLPPILAALLKRHPGLRPRLYSGTASQIQDEILEGRAELGLFYAKVREKRELEAEPVRFVEFWLVAAPGRGPVDLS